MAKGKYKILIVDDEEDIVEILNYNLQQSGYETAYAYNGEDALKKAQLFHPHLIILDVMMPVMDGMQVLAAIRRDNSLSGTRVLFLTALNTENAEISGLNLGADDYLTKPVKPQLLLSRVRALLRRVKKEEENTFAVGDLIINREKFLVEYQGKEVVLAKKEFELLALLASKPNCVFLRNEILSKVWGSDIIVGDRTIDVHIRKIRQKAGDIITTVKGVGYKLDV